MLVRIRTKISNILISQSKVNWEDILDKDHAQLIAKGLVKILNKEEIDRGSNRDRNEREFETSFHIVKSEDFQLIVDQLYEIRSQLKKNERGSLKKIYELLSKNYEKDGGTLHSDVQ